MSVKFSNAENRVQAVVLYCEHWQLSLIWNTGKGSLTFSRIMLTVDDYHILQTSACVGFDVLLRMSTSFLLDIFWPLVHVEVSVAVSSFMSYWSSILHYSPHLCGKEIHHFSHPGKDLVFSKPLSSLSPHPFLFPFSVSFEKGARPLTGGFMVDPCKNHYRL